jgi:hypothetical protein
MTDPISIAATVIALAALAVAVLEGLAARRHNRISVVPHLSVLQSVSGAPADLVGLRLKNNGVGPAVLRSVTLAIDGQRIGQGDALTWLKVMHQLGVAENWLEATALEPGEAIGAGDYQNLLFVQHQNRTEESIKRLTRALFRLSLEVSYESVYGAKFSCSWKWPIQIGPANVPEPDAE